MKQTITKGLIAVLSVLVLATGCRKREAELPQILANFEFSSQGLEANDNSITVKVELTRGVDANTPIIINVTSQNAVYGTDYTITPAPVSNQITVTVPAGNNEASFVVSKVPGALYDGDEKVVFDIYSSASPVYIGASKQMTLTFKELVATSSTSTINGGGATFPNKVFIDLSANRHTPVLRTNWDLGFYTGADDYRVILNSSSAMMAKQISKTDLNQVTAADTLGFAADVVFNQFAPTTTSLPYIDYPTGDLTKTAIAAISSTPSENKVYIINRGTGVGTSAPARGWKKVRIVRNANGGYTLQYADINATSFQEIGVAKDEAYFFKYVSFDNGAVSVEPEKKKWDIAWTYFSNITNFGTGEVPYLFQDIIVQNRNVQVAKVMTSVKAFADFNEASLSDASLALNWSTSQTAIGSDWRAGGGPTSAPAVRTDRYYVVKDGDNNYYKVRFTALTQNGERGYPAYEAVLVKKG